VRVRCEFAQESAIASVIIGLRRRGDDHDATISRDVRGLAIAKQRGFLRAWAYPEVISSAHRPL
jgi:hypothetical protein